MNIVNNIIAILIFCTLVLASIVAAMTISSHLVKGQNASRYDCGMAEWHPDVPNEVRKKCRASRVK